MTLKGTFKASYSWVGVHEEGVDGHMFDIGYAIDPM